MGSEYRNKKLEAMELALEADGLVERDGMNPLHRACAMGAQERVRILLAHGASVVDVDVDGKTPLNIACSSWSGSASIVRLLLAHGADANARDNNGRTALHEAVSHSKADLVSALLEHSIDINATDSEGKTALHVAMLETTMEIIEMLLAAGANTGAVDMHGNSVVRVACDHTRLGALKALFIHGVDPDMVDEDGNTLLHIAAHKHERFVVCVLLARNSDVHARNKHGETPLTRCLQWGLSRHNYKEALEVAYQLMSKHAVYEGTFSSSPSTDARTHDGGEILRLCVEHWATEQQRGISPLTRVPYDTLGRGPAAVKAYLDDLNTTSNVQ
ncbi:hypothetical protein Poli38472_001399 [Pythium oligandrum]|uniref:Ankyrin repeat protein n=1 Tax=Pythium oligandrum TaxID=41045 RepID=A0A8K1CUK9_PYTOL|nr:hypothetical protein Poli38472_001399 [Pythium oligandrum]|eukprot:TMW69243.1 hypothetical protein Poli38472_001399 [Pythium oligandrum]